MTERRLYNSETDYPVVLEACREAGEIAIAPPIKALVGLGIDLVGGVEAQVDYDIRRAWKELGYRNVV